MAKCHNRRECKAVLNLISMEWKGREGVMEWHRYRSMTMKAQMLEVVDMAENRSLAFLLA